MIHEIVKELGARLVALGLGISVGEGPENPTTTWGKERVVVEHTFDGDADSFTATRGVHRNPKVRRNRVAAYKLTVYAQSTKAGANLFEHCRRAEKILDQVLVAMDYVAARRRARWEPKTGRFFTPENLKAAENPGGVAYELAFTFERAVTTRTWDGEKQPEAQPLVGGRSTTKVSLAHAPGSDSSDPSTVPADAETACGA